MLGNKGDGPSTTTSSAKKQGEELEEQAVCHTAAKLPCRTPYAVDIIRWNSRNIKVENQFHLNSTHYKLEEHEIDKP